MNTIIINWRRVAGAILLLCAVSLIIYLVGGSIWMAQNFICDGNLVCIQHHNTSGGELLTSLLILSFWELQFVLPILWLGHRMYKQAWIRVNTWFIAFIVILSVVEMSIACYDAYIQTDVIYRAWLEYGNEVLTNELPAPREISLFILILLLSNTLLCLQWTKQVANRKSDYREIKTGFAISFDAAQLLFLLSISIVVFLKW